MTLASLFIAIAAMAVVTASCRVLPFLLPRRSRLLLLLSGDHPGIRIVGPALLVGIAIATFVAPVLQSPSASTLLPYGVGGLATAGVFHRSRSVGLAVIAGVLVFGSTDYGLTSMLV